MLSILRRTDSKKWRGMRQIRHLHRLKKAVGDFPSKLKLGKAKSILISSEIKVIDGIKQFQMPMDNFPSPFLEIRGTILPNFDENQLPLYKAVQREKFMFYVTAIRSGSYLHL